MLTVDELTKQTEALRVQMAQLEAVKQQAAEQQRAEQLDKLREFDELAESYRNQAARAVEADKPMLYRLADESQDQAYELRKELGLLPANAPTPDDRERQDKQSTIRRINGLVVKAAISLTAYLFADYTAGHMDEGFISFVLKYVAQILFNASALFGGLWLCCIAAQSLMFGYTISRLKTDFLSLSPAVRVGLLVALLAAFLHYLTAVVPHAN